MSIRSENQDFLTYRETGDTQALARVFDAVAPRLLLLAAHLAPDAGQAEDLVQTTFLCGMRDADRWDSTRPIEHWLAGILNHRALDLRRSAAVRAHDPFVDEATAELDPAELVADQELFERVVKAIESIAAPYREVLALHVVHGLKARGIAHALVRAPGTVRMQLKRGLERLRSAVPERSTLLGLYLLEPTRGLDVVKESVLAKASPNVVVASAGGAFLGGLVLLKSIALVAAVLILSVVYYSWPSEDNAQVDPPVSQARTDLVQPVDAPGESNAVLASASNGAEQRAAVISDEDLVADEISSAFEVRVRYERNGQPAEDVGLYIRRDGDSALGIESRTDVAGLASFSELDAGQYMLHVDRLEEAIPFQAGASKRLEVQIPVGLTVQGAVLDLDSAPVPGARIMRLNPLHHDVLQVVARSDANGTFELIDVAPGTELLARVDGFQPSELETARDDGSGASAVRLVMGARGHKLRGRVLDEAGEPVPRAWVGLAVDEDAREAMRGSDEEPTTRERGKAMDLEGILLRADDQGRFESREVPAGYVLVIARPVDLASEAVATETLWINYGEESEVVLRLRRGAVVEGVITDSDGRPVVGANLESEWEGTPRLGQLEDDIGPLISDRWATSAEDGSFRLPGLIAGDYDLRVNGRRSELLQTERLIGESEHVIWNPVVAPQTNLIVRLIDPQGIALSDWAIAISDDIGRQPSWEHFSKGTSANGKRTLLDLERDKRCVVLAYPPNDDGGFSRLPSAIRKGVSPAIGELTLQLTHAELQLGSLTGQLIAASGELQRDSRVTLRMFDGLAEVQATTDGDGNFRFDNLPAGNYRLLSASAAAGFANFSRSRRSELANFDLAPGAIRDLGQVGLAAK